MLPANYAPDYAPFTVTEGGLVKVQVKLQVEGWQEGTLSMLSFQIDLTKILDINEVGQTFGNQFNLYMTW